MEEYIKEALHQDFIRPSISPAASSFFFVAKKAGDLRPCIDYRALKAQIVKYCYPLLWSRLHSNGCETQAFTKLELCSTYKLIQIRKGDERKTMFITPSGHYSFQVMP